MRKRRESCIDERGSIGWVGANQLHQMMTRYEKLWNHQTLDKPWEQFQNIELQLRVHVLSSVQPKMQNRKQNQNQKKKSKLTKAMKKYKSRNHHSRNSTSRHQPLQQTLTHNHNLRLAAQKPHASTPTPSPTSPKLCCTLNTWFQKPPARVPPIAAAAVALPLHFHHQPPEIWRTRLSLVDSPPSVCTCTPHNRWNNADPDINIPTRSEKLTLLRAP